MILKVIQKKDESNNSFSLIFEKPKDFIFYPGQYLDIKLPVKDPNGNTRAFTISSSPTEEFLMITPKKGISPFKKYLESLKEGDIIESSHPAGTFTLDETEPVVFLAGGIGITPFRSMIKFALNNKIIIPITLIHSNSDDDFPFKKELNKWQKLLPNLTIIYHNSTKSGRLTNLPTSHFKDPTSHFPLPTSIYYLAGSHSFVNEMARIVKRLGVDETNIRLDKFDGYL